LTSGKYKQFYEGKSLKICFCKTKTERSNVFRTLQHHFLLHNLSESRFVKVMNMKQ